MIFHVVIIEVTLCSKWLIASRCATMIRFLTRMQSKMGLKITLFVERLTAAFERAHKVLCAIVAFQVDFESLHATVRLVASGDRTLVSLLVFMSVCVISQMTFRHERFIASGEIAFKRSIILQLLSSKIRTRVSISTTLNHALLTWIFWCSKSCLREPKVLRHFLEKQWYFCPPILSFTMSGNWSFSMFLIASSFSLWFSSLSTLNFFSRLTGCCFSPCARAAAASS